MSTLDIKKTRIAYILVTIFCAIFSIVYEYFSFGEYSYFMRLMFLAPLFGIVPYVLNIRISRISYALWNSAIAIFTSGCLVKGIINISGRYFDYDYLYFIVGAVFLLLAILFIFKDNTKNN